MGANPNIFTNKENRRVVPPEEENFFVSAEEFKAIDTAFASKADQTDLDTLDGRVGTLETDLGTAESNIIGLGTSKENTANKTDSFDVINTTLFPNWKGVQDYLNEEVPDSDEDNFLTVSNFAIFKNQYGRRDTSVITFDRPCIYAGSFDLTTRKVLTPLYTSLSVLKDSAFHKNESIVFHSSDSVPSVLDGTKPSWLILTGDSYLTGIENINVLNFQYFERTKLGVTYYTDVVICDIQAFANGNTDLNQYLLLDLNFNENDSPVEIDSVINHSPLYAAEYVPEVITPLQSSYEDLGGGNYALISGTNDVSFPTRSETIINVDPAFLTRITDKVTVIARIKAIAFSTENIRTIFSSYSINGGGTNVRRGFRMTLDSTGRLVMRVSRADGTTTTDYSADITKLVVTGNGYYVIATTIECIGTTPEIKSWWKSVGNTIPFENILNTVGSHELSLESPLNFSLDKADVLVSTSSRATGKDQIYLWDTILTDEQIETIANELDPDL